MKTVKSFIKNYKKILIGSLICLIIILSVTIGSMIVGVREELDETNDIQLNEVINNLDNIYDYSTNIVDWMRIVTEEGIGTMARLLRLSPEDFHEPAILDQYKDALSNLYQLKVLDRDRNEVYSSNFDTNENFNDSYFDPLFAAGQGQSATLPARNGEQIQYICAQSGDYYILSEVADVVSQNSEVGATAWQQAFALSGFSSISTVAVVDDETGEVIYCDDDSLILEKIDTEQVNTRAECRINGQVYKAKAYSCPERGVCLITLTNYRDIIDSYTANIILVITLFVAVLFILLSYVVCLRQGELDPSQEYKFAGKYYLRSQTRMFRTVIIILGVIFSFTFISVSMLNSDIEHTLYLQKEVYDSVDVIDSYQVMESMIETENADKLYDYARIAGKYLTFHPDRMTKKDLGEIAQLLDVSGVSLFDQNGKTVCTSTPMDHFSVTEDKESPLYELRYVLMGKEGISVSGDPKTMDETDVIYAVPNRGEDGVADGITAVITYYGMTNKDAFGLGAGMKGTDQKLKVSRNRQGFMLVVADKEGKIILHQNENLIGASLEDIGIDSETIRHNEGNGTVGRLKINGRDQLFTVMMTRNDDNYVILMQQAGLLSGVSVSTAVLAIILYILLACWIMYDGLGSKFHFEERKQKVRGADNWRDSKGHWHELSAGQKMSGIIGICVHIFSVYLIITYFLARYKIIDPVGIAYIMLGDWQKSVNIYSIFGNICLAAIFFSIISFTAMVLHTASNASEQSGKTACRLLANIIKYVGAIICCYLIVTNFGVNAAAAIASIGIAGFGLTFGAQDLIKDLIAGMFILFEGNFKVGDMLVVDGKWFWVKSIGVRTTTLEAWGEKKVINNSQMSGVLNIQRATTSVDCDIMIDNRYDLDLIEEILNRELPSLKENYPAEVVAPEYKGVQKLSGSGTTIRIRAYVPPLYQGRVGRKLRGDVKRIFDKYGITFSSDRFTIVNNNLTQEELAEALLKKENRM